MDFVTYLFFIFLVMLIGITPFFILYGVSDFVRFILHRVIGYRKGVVRSNLRKVFPEKSKKELRQIENDSYKNLADIFVEGVKGFTMSKKSIMKRHKLLNPEILDKYYDKNQGVIVAAGHFGNWEWGAFSAAYYTKSTIIGLYKPFTNRYINNYVVKSRAVAGTILVPLIKTPRYFNKYAGKPSVFFMIADQSPSNKNKAIWANFFGIETAFLQGIEYYSKKFNLPVLFVNMSRKGRMMYEYSVEIMVENPNETKEGEITQLFATKLESLIRANPGSWLWSHKRWKHSKS